jgi:hypothetical protein
MNHLEAMYLVTGMSEQYLLDNGKVMRHRIQDEKIGNCKQNSGSHSGSHIYQLQIKEEKLGNTSFHGLA